jgi:hypothetical protein
VREIRTLRSMSAGHAGERICDAGARAGEWVGRSVKEQPLLSLIGVAAIGYAIGFLVRAPFRGRLFAASISSRGFCKSLLGCFQRLPNGLDGPSLWQSVFRFLI